MFGLLAPALAKALASVFEGISSENVAASLLGRRLRLMNVSVRRDALEDARAPVRVRSVRVAMLEVKFSPFSRDAVVVRASGVEAEAEARTEVDEADDYDELTRRRDAREAMMGEIAAEMAAKLKSGVEGGSGWGGAIVAAAFERLTVELEDFSVVFRDNAERKGVIRAGWRRVSMKSVGGASTRPTHSKEVPLVDDGEREEAEEGHLTDDEQNAKRAKEESDVSFSGDVLKRVEMSGLYLVVDDGMDASSDVVGPSARVRLDVRLRRRPTSERYIRPEASPYVASVAVRDDIHVSASTSQVRMVQLAIDEMDMWTKRMAHGERRPKNKDPIEWWRYAVRATVPRGQRHRARLLARLKHARAQLESCVEVYTERILGKQVATPKHVKVFETGLTVDDLLLIKSLAERKAAIRRRTIDEADGMLPSENVSFSASQIFEDIAPYEAAEPRLASPPPQPKLTSGFTGYLYKKSSSYLTRAYGYIRYRNAPNVGTGRDFESAVKITVPCVHLTLRDESSNRVKLMATEISVTHGTLRTDDDGVLAETEVKLGQLRGEDLSDGVEKLMWARAGHEGRPAVIVKMNPDACPNLDMLASVHVQISPMVTALRPSTVRLLLAMLRALDTPFSQAYKDSTLALNNRSPDCRLQMIKILGPSMMQQPLLLEVDSPIFVIPAKKSYRRFKDSSGAYGSLAFGVDKFVMSLENGLRAREGAFDELIERATTALKQSSSETDSWKAIEELSSLALRSRAFIFVDGGWMSAANAPAPVVSNIKMTLVNDASVFDSNVTMIDVDPIEIELSPESIAALVYVAESFSDVSPPTPSSSTLPTTNFGIRFDAPRVQLCVGVWGRNVKYIVEDVRVAAKGSESEWRLLSTLGSISGIHSVRSMQTKILSCASEGTFLKAHVCSRIAGKIDIAAVDARITRPLLETLADVAAQTKGLKGVTGELIQPPTNSSVVSTQEEFLKAWNSVEHFEISDSQLSFLHGCIEPMTLKLFEESDDTDAIILTTRAMQIQGNASRVEADLPALSLSILSVQMHVPILAFESMHMFHSFGANTADNLSVGSIAVEITPVHIQRLITILQSIPQIPALLDGSTKSPSASKVSGPLSIPNVELAFKRIKLSARDEDEIALTFSDVGARVAAREGSLLGSVQVDAINLDVQMRHKRGQFVRLVGLNGETGSAVKASAIYTPVEAARDRLKLEVLIGDGVIDLNAPCIIAGVKILGDISRAIPAQAAPTDGSHEVLSKDDGPSISAEISTGVWTFELPWRSEVELHAPMRRMRLRMRQAAALHDFVPGSQLEGTLVLSEFKIETGYCKDEDDLEGSSVMFTISEIIGLTAHINLPAASTSYFAREVAPRVDVNAQEIRGNANEISLHLLQEISALILAQPATAEAIETYENLPSSTASRLFDVYVNVEILSLCLEHTQAADTIPVIQSMMTSLRADVKSTSAGVDVNFATTVEMDYLHPVKMAWEPILEPAGIVTSMVLSPDFKPTTLSVSVASGIELTVSHNVVEALLKAQVVMQAAQNDIVDLEHATTFGPCTYQMTNATGFDVDYTLSLVRDDNITLVGAGRTATGRTQVMRFAKKESSRSLQHHRVIEHGESYWASPIDEDDSGEMDYHDPTQEPVPHVSVDFRDIDVDIEEMISLHGIDEERRLLEYTAHLADGSEARIIAEMGPCSNKVNRYELLLRSDVAILNGTSFPVALCFHQSVALPSTVFGPILPGESVWLPIPLCQSRKVQWRAVAPDEKFNEITPARASDGESFAGSPFLSPLHRTKSFTTNRSPTHGASLEHQVQHNWSTAIAFADLLANGDIVEASLCSSVTSHEVEVSKPYTCAFTVTRSETLKRVQLALCPPLKFVNLLPLQMVVTCRSRNAFKHDTRTENRVVGPGEAIVFTTLHPTWSATVIAQVIGYEACEELIVPEYTVALKNAKRQASGEIYHMDRDAFPVDRTNASASGAAVSLRFAFSIDDVTHGRTLHCAVPLIVLNSTSCGLVLEDMLYGTETEEPLQDGTAVLQETPRIERVDSMKSPLRLFAEDAENFETPSMASPLARLAQNQASWSQLARADSSSTFDVSPLLHRKSSFHLLPAEGGVMLVTPSTPGQRSTPQSSATSSAFDEHVEGFVRRATILGTSAHWRKSVKNRPRVRIRLKSSRFWSQPFRIDNTGVPVEISIPSSASADVCEHRFVVASAASTGDKMFQTAKLSIRPKFVVKSMLDEGIWMRHGGTENIELLPPKGTRPLRWFDWRGKSRKEIMFRPEKGIFEWSRPVHVPDHVASILKMRHIGGGEGMHTETITVSMLENDDGTFIIKVARPSEVDGVLGMHTIENHSSLSIWYHQLGADEARTHLGAKESDERMIEDSSLPRALVIGYGNLQLGEPISLDVSRELSYSVVTTDRNCLRITVTRSGPMCSVLVEDALSARISATPERPVLRSRGVERQDTQLELNVKLGWMGVSVLHAHEELMYARINDVAVKVLTDGSEFKSAVRVRSARIDHTSARAKRPIVLAIPERHQSAREALELHVHGWMHKLNGLPVVRSLKVDLAPAFIDIHDELLDSIPLAIEPCVRHADLLLPPVRSVAKSGGKKSSKKRQQDGETMSALTSVYLQELIINDVELILSFSRLPGLPVAFRSFAGVDRAHLRLRGFHMNQPSLMAADVGMMAARHFSREAVMVASSLWAHNSLLGDPKRLWGDISDALHELNRGSIVTALPRVVMALIAAFAHSGETALSQARDVVDGWLEALEVAQASRKFTLQTRRLGTADDLTRRAAETLIQRSFETVARVVFDIIDGPLIGIEAGGVRGLIEGSVIGVTSALARVLAASLEVAELSARRLRLFAAIKTFDDSEYMRPRRPLPTSYMDPVRPYHFVEALGRATLAKLGTSESGERFVAAASLTWPSRDLCVLTGGRLLVINRSSEPGSNPYVRASVRFADITGVLRDANRVSVHSMKAVDVAPVRVESPQSAFIRAYSFAFSALKRVSANSTLSSKDVPAVDEQVVPKIVVVRCADEDAARWLASTLSPFVNANARSGSHRGSSA